MVARTICQGQEVSLIGRTGGRGAGKGGSSVRTNVRKPAWRTKGGGRGAATTHTRIHQVDFYKTHICEVKTKSKIEAMGILVPSSEHRWR